MVLEGRWCIHPASPHLEAADSMRALRMTRIIRLVRLARMARVASGGPIRKPAWRREKTFENPIPQI
jgi:hypothetical protein